MKPPYKVPGMADIEAIPWNGYNVISTFSGCGGSCLGYRMAGFRVLWANEFIPAAQEVYKLNHPNSILDTRDIRKVKAQDILDATGMSVGEIDLMDGSPPCASFSTAGKREKGWGEVKNYSDTKQRVDDLFFEYARLVEGLQPKVLVAENVSGLVKGTAKGYFKQILKELKGCGYNVRAKVLNAQWLGVPQARQRLIFIGVRNDLEVAPVFPMPFKYTYSVRDALPDVLRHGTAPPHGDWVGGGSDIGKTMVDSGAFPIPTILQSGLNKGVGIVEVSKLIHDTSGRFSVGDITSKPCNTITQQSAHWRVEIGNEKRKLTIDELKRLCAFPDDFKLVGSYNKQWERLGRAVPPVMMKAIAETIRDEVLIKCLK